MTVLADSLGELEQIALKELDLLAYPRAEWVPERKTADGKPVRDVLIVGGGQGGLALAFKLMRERITNIQVIDENPPGEEGPWLSYARMITLRSPKDVTGPDLGIPSLTFQAWYEAQHGEDGWTRLGKIPKETWVDYLNWYRDFLKLPVASNTRMTSLSPDADGHIAVEVTRDGNEETLHARKVILATGIESMGYWWMPDEIVALPSHLRAHSSETIDFEALQGKRVAVLGVGASAMDNAGRALEAGAASVHAFSRREELQRVQPFKWLSWSGFLDQFHKLDDDMRWRFMTYLLTLREAFPAETWERCTRHQNFKLLTGASLENVSSDGQTVRIGTPKGTFECDFVIAGTGFAADLSKRPELSGFHHHIATWADRYTPPADAANERLADYPYLSKGYQLLEKQEGSAPWLRHIRLFSFASTMSFGPSGSSINAMKFAVPRLVDSLSADLFQEDAELHFANLLKYDTPEFPLD